MSLSGSQATMAQNYMQSPIGHYLSGNDMDMQLTFFRGESDPYAAFATNWVKLNFQTTTMQAGAVETSTYAEMQRSGDMLCHAFLVITAPAIANVSMNGSSQVAMEGDGSVAVAGQNSAIRAFVHCGRPTADRAETRLLTINGPVAVGDTTITLDNSVADTVSAGDQYELYAKATGHCYRGSVASVSTSGLVVTIAAHTDFAAEIADDAGQIAFFGSRDSVLGNSDLGAYVDVHDHDVLRGACTKNRTNGPTGVPPTNDTGMVPNIPILDRDQVHAHYGTYAPCALIKELEVVIGSNPLSKVTGLVMQANCELWVASDRLPRRAVNKSDDPAEKGGWALHRQTWAVPVPFWFNQGGYHSSLALCALSFHSIRFNLTLNPYTRSIVNGCGGDFTGNVITLPGAGYTLKTYAGATSQAEGDHIHDIDDGVTAAAAPSTTLAGSQFGFYMLLELIYLSDDERDTYTDMTDEVLITQFQYASQQTLSSNTQSVEMPLRFNHPVSHVVVAGQLQSNQNDNRWGEYEGPTRPLSVSDRHPEGTKSHWLKTMQLTFNNTARTAVQPAWFFHETVPSVNAERCPDHHFYLYSFGLTSPNGSGQFSGGADFSRLDNAYASIVSAPQLYKDQSQHGGMDNTSTNGADTDSITGGQKVFVDAFGVNANVAKFENGLVGVCFM